MTYFGPPEDGAHLGDVVSTKGVNQFVKSWLVLGAVGFRKAFQGFVKLFV